MINEKSNLRIEFTSLFTKQRREASDEIQLALIETLELFRDDPFQDALRNHPLKGKYAGHRSIDIDYDWRAIYKEVIKGQATTISFVAFGTHEQLYAE